MQRCPCSAACWRLIRPPALLADPVPDGRGADDRAAGGAALLCAAQELQGLSPVPGRRGAGGLGLDLCRCASMACGSRGRTGAGQARHGGRHAGSRAGGGECGLTWAATVLALAAAHSPATTAPQGLRWRCGASGCSSPPSSPPSSPSCGAHCRCGCCCRCLLICSLPQLTAAAALPPPCRRRMPFLKKVLDLPAFKALINKVAPAGGGLPV